MPLLFLAAVLVFGIWAVRRISDSNRAVAAAAGGPAAPAVAIDPAVHELRLRYARGELDRDEFAQRWRDLGGEGPEPPPPVPTDAA